MQMSYLTVILQCTSIEIKNCFTKTHHLKTLLSFKITNKRIYLVPYLFCVLKSLLNEYNIYELSYQIATFLNTIGNLISDYNNCCNNAQAFFFAEKNHTIIVNYFLNNYASILELSHF